MQLVHVKIRVHRFSSFGKDKQAATLHLIRYVSIKIVFIMNISYENYTLFIQIVLNILGALIFRLRIFEYLVEY